MKGIIFDFNGTMFQDSHLHEKAWFFMVKKYSSKAISDKDILINIHGRTNKEILTYFISKDLTSEEIEKMSFEKEAYYRELCLKNKDELRLTKGLADILNRLKKSGMPMTIATATVKENVEFYFDVFHLDQWFDFDKVTFDDGSFPGKPAPDIFMIASNKLGLMPNECLVIEDAFSGLTAAKKAGIGKIIAIDPFGKNRSLFEEKQLASGGIITDFTAFFDVIAGSSIFP
ncbi:HAD family phosphatase [Bacillus sp. ISL-51]|uniref:HAD family hydrolase n=1 Tax=Bacteria TaxID=2 RepID=UPI001BE8B9F7|nr:MULTISPECIES: HAD family phosphatase [Bacteria]MBT2573761.1 HAD family phosphatase [Bacillus sp. ISL-51]MBT2634908.1 HAD family phosphatase [Bacillus sp. ISL-26]MBT2712382.1 HAD family phosphatase [Pseudomonas sp. ISL-88]